jgi:arylsulfatase A-like enzyme
MIQVRHKEILFYLIILTGFFLLLETSFFIQCNKIYLTDSLLFSQSRAVLLAVLPGMLYFILAQCLVHLGFCLLVWVLVSLTAVFFKLSYDKTLILTISAWLIGLIWILAANQYYFPNSKFSELTAVMFPDGMVKWVLILASLCVVALFFFALLASRALKVLVGLVGVAWCLVEVYPGMPQHTHGVIDSKPNIIIIGVDSLRPDFVGSSTPSIQAFLNKATVFSEAITPLARTFPSWMGILSGEYPRVMGVRSNLVSQPAVHFSQMLPDMLRRDGYETFYATDESRFSNIDTAYGFDHVISPPMGLNDFLLGTFNDFPIANLLVNTLVGKWLFPNSYANRAVYITYNPNSFLEQVRQYIFRSSPKPMFLAIHFCLPHSPYLWSELSDASGDILLRYKKSVARVDQQVGDFLVMLKDAGILERAVVVLLSDHGEALELTGDRITQADLFLKSAANQAIPKFYPPSLDDESVNQSAGHGTDVLSLTQYHTLLAFKLYGMTKQNESQIAGIVTLLDVKPTVLELIGHGKGLKQSLAPFILGKGSRVHTNEHIYLESDFTPTAMRTVYPNLSELALEGIKIFAVDPQSTRLAVKSDMGQMIIKSKQVADIFGDWMLALYPQADQRRIPILVNLETGYWTNDLSSSFAERAPVAEMLASLHSFYGTDIQ